MRIYTELLGIPDARSRAYNHSVRIYLSLGRWVELETLLRERLDEDPTNVEALLTLGRSLSGQGRMGEARRVWEESVAAAGPEAGTVERVAEYALEAGMLDVAVFSYREARERRKDPAAYALELAGLYQRRHEVEKAIGEILLWLEANPRQHAVVEGELRRILWDSEHEEEARGHLLEVFEDRRQWAELGRVLVNLWLERGWCEEALRLAEASAGGHAASMVSLVEVGDKSRESGCTEVAIQAYRMAAGGVPGEQEAALLSLGGLLVELGRDREAAHELGRFLDAFPGSSDAVEVRYELGRVLLRLGRPDEALMHLRHLIRNHPEHPKGAEARFAAAECLIGLGRVDDAAKELEGVRLDNLGEREEELLYTQGEILFLAGRFEDALVRYREVFQRFSEGVYVNDALSRALLIGQSQVGGEDALALYAGALYFERQGHWSRALAQLDSLVLNHPQAGLSDRALIARAEIELKSGFPNRAVDALDNLLAEHPGSLRAAEAMILKGDIQLERLNNPAGAREIYESALMEYPDSPLLDGVRRKLRALEETVP